VQTIKFLVYPVVVAAVWVVLAAGTLSALRTVNPDLRATGGSEQPASAPSDTTTPVPVAHAGPFNPGPVHHG